MSKAIYPGSFDPLTNGHMDIIERASKTFDQVVVAISNNAQKNHTFDVPTRAALVRECVAHFTNVEVDVFDTLLVDYARQKKIGIILRGLRAVSDFEYEFQIAAMNRTLTKEVDTMFLMTGEASYFVSSRLVREVASFGGDVSKMVPKPVWDALQKHYNLLKLNS